MSNLNKQASRRNFIKKGGISAAGWFILPRWIRQIHPPFIQGFPLHNIPTDKHIDPKWLKSLYKRGTPTTYLKSKNELKYIGMPAGGLHSGSLYLGGDGRLWLWEIYNDDREGITPKTVQWFDGEKQRDIRNRDGANYVSPAVADEHRKLEQGFAIKIKLLDKVWIKPLAEDQWDEITFTATYPQAKIEYYAKDLPVKVVMTAGAFYIPLNENDSSLPATAISIEVTNTGDTPLDISIIGWLENGVGKDTCLQEDGSTKITEPIALHAASGIYHSATMVHPATRDSGSMCLALMDHDATIGIVKDSFDPKESTLEQVAPSSTVCIFPKKLIGIISSRSQVLHTNEVFKADYAISWYFNHSLKKLQRKMPESTDGYYYGEQFANAGAVMNYIAKNFKTLSSQTALWQSTFYDATLPHWLLERSIINIGTIATANTYRFASGRFWGWEGVNACEGTCTHVWQYGHTLARLFPSLERDTRERVDLDIALLPDGGIEFRGEFDTRPAIDGQAGTILRIYREHQMSAGASFLKRNWEKIKKAIVFLISQDKNGDGMTDTPMENTLDAVWEGEIAWIVGLSIAAVKAGQFMASEMLDDAFASKCEDYVTKGIKGMEESLFNGEYFIHQPDKVSGRKKLGSYNTCHIDQVYGQSWAFQVGLGRLWDKDKTISALKSLWKYNFAPDVGPYIKTHLGGRPYALPGEAGMIMNTNPHNEPHPYGDNTTWQLGYFHECMTGFEHQVAAHMMAEGMTDQSLILTRSIHNRYHASKRNPYNEIECSDHYARAMASYGTYISACGFYYHGPKGEMGFYPKLHPQAFKAAFTAAEGWGSFQQQVQDSENKKALICALTLHYGKLNLSKFYLESGPLIGHCKKILVRLNNQNIKSGFEDREGRLGIIFLKPITILAGQRLEITLQ